MRGLRLVCLCRLPDHKVTQKISPLFTSELVERIYLVRRLPYEGPKVVCYCPPRWMRRFVVFSECYRLLATLFLCATKRPHALVGYGLVLHGLIASISGCLFRIPVIQLLLGKVDFTVFERSWVRRRIFEFAIRQAAFIGVRGEHTKQRLVRQGVSAEKLFIPHNVFDFQDFPPATRPKDIDVINVGRHIAFRRLDILLRVFARLRESRNGLRFVQIGGGWTGDQETRKLHKLAKDLRLDSCLEFVGALDHDDVVDYLQRARLFCMTSEDDGLPMAMIEAMSCGVPCVVPEDADITTVAQHDSNALVVRMGDIEEFASAITRLLDDETLYGRIQAGALKLREERAWDYSLKGVREVWETVLVQLDGTRPPQSSDDESDSAAS